MTFFHLPRETVLSLGLYESGAVRKVRFTQMGVSYIFCNIHPDMSAEVVALATPHFALTAPRREFPDPQCAGRDVPA